MKRLNKKAYGILDLLYFAVIFIALTILLSFGSTILSDLKTDQTAYMLDLVANETHTVVLNTPFALAEVPLAGTTITVRNATDPWAKIDIANTSVNSAANSTVFMGFNCGAGVDVLVTYNFTDTIMGQDFNVSGKGEDAIYKFAKWTPTLANVLVAAVIIAILMGAFMFAVTQKQE